MAYNVKFLKGTAESYNASSKNVNTFYYVDEKDLYLGSLKLTNAAELAVAVGRIDTAEGKITDNEEAIEQLRKDLGALTGEGSGTISEMIDEAIEALRTDLEDKIQVNTDAIAAEKTRAEGIEAGLRTDIDSTMGSLATLQQTVTDNETDIEGKVSALDQRVSDNEGNIGTLTTNVGTLQQNVGTLTTDLGNLEDRVEANEGAITTLVGEDANKSVRTIANEELVKQLIEEGAAENLDTLAEIAAWIQDHPEDAAAMNLAIEELQEAIAAINNETTGILKQANDYTDEKVGEVQDQVDLINDPTSGILKQANTYTDTEVKKVSDDLAGYKETVAGEFVKTNDNVSKNATDIANLTTTVNNNAATAQSNLEAAIAALKTEHNLTGKLGTAAYKNVEDFDAAGAASTAETNAKAYTDTALTWQNI